MQINKPSVQVKQSRLRESPTVVEQGATEQQQKLQALMKLSALSVDSNKPNQIRLKTTHQIRRPGKNHEKSLPKIMQINSS